MKQERNTAMSTQVKDPQLARYVDEIAQSIHWPETAFTLSLAETVMGLAVTFYQAFATPDRVMLEHALKGIAF
jgi:hypothetical protein